MRTLLIALCLISPALAQGWSPGDYMMQAMGKVAAVAKRVSDQPGGMGFESKANCLFGAVAGQGAVLDLTQELTAGTEYVFIAAGDSDALDIDLEVLRKEKVVKADRKADALPIVRYKPRKTGQHTIRLTLRRALTPNSFVGLAILRSGGYAIPVQSLVESLQGTVQKTAALSQELTSRSGSGLRFHDATGDWALFAGVLERGEAAGLGGINFREGAVVIAGGDGHAQDLDMSVMDGTDRRIAADTSADALPAVAFQPGLGEHRVVVSNPESRSPTLFTALLLAPSRGALPVRGPQVGPSDQLEVLKPIPVLDL